MAKIDLWTLKTAIQSGNEKFHHGDVKKDMVDALDELIETRDKLEEIKELADTLVTLSISRQS